MNSVSMIANVLLVSINDGCSSPPATLREAKCPTDIGTEGIAESGRHDQRDRQEPSRPIGPNS